MENYSVGVAVFDLLPVALSATALVLLARGIGFGNANAGPIALLGAVLVASGGLCKALWKLIIALGGPNIPLLEHLLFILMAPGFLALTLALRAYYQGLTAGAAPSTPKRSTLIMWMLLPLLLAALGNSTLSGERSWFFILLAFTTVANALLLYFAVRCGRFFGLSNAITAAFVFNFVATLALSGLSRLPPTELSAWIQEGVNFGAQGALFAGCWHLSHRMREACS